MTQWNALTPGSELRATVLMASGFVLPAGQRVEEHYRVTRVLGEGAMGQVLAVTLAGGGAGEKPQAFALKVVARPAAGGARADEGPTTAAARVEAERDAHWLAELLRQEAAKQDEVQRHGVSVARLFALVQLDDGTIGLRMELARGRSLEAWLAAERLRRSEPPDVPAALLVVRKLLSQLRRLHELASAESPSGFIHSDIKPGNVFVDESDPGDPAITLLDFGVATAGQALVADLAMRASSRQTFVLQQTGGTLGYAPPHHFTGAATPLSDVYAALVILYELVTLEMPWDFGALELSTDNLVQVEAAQLRGPRPVRAARASIPEPVAHELDAFFAREFKSLHARAAEAAEVLGANGRPGGDEATRRALGARLVHLAREYQGALDALRVTLTHEPAGPGTTGPNPVAFASTALALEAAPHDKPTVARTPSARRAAEAAAAAGSEVSAEAGAPAVQLGSSVLPRRAAPRAAAVAASVLLALLVAVVYLRMRDRGARATGSVAPTADASVARDVPAVVRAAVDAAPAPPPPSPAPPEVSADALRNAPVVALPSHLRERTSARPHAGAAVASSSSRASDAGALVDAGAGATVRGQACVCVAPVRGAQVVAHGGLLGRDVVVCAAAESLAAGRAQYFGRGAVAPEVTAALASFTCRAPDGASMQLVVGRYGARGGTELLLDCRPVRVEPPPAPPSTNNPPAPANTDASLAAASADATVADDAGPRATPPGVEPSDAGAATREAPDASTVPGTNATTPDPSAASTGNAPHESSTAAGPVDAQSPPPP